jgi:hypothetical protein
LSRWEPRYAAAIAHPEWYYGFIAVALAWQAAFLVIAGNPVRYRSIMLPAMLEKFGYVATLAVLYMQGRLNASQLAIGSPDLILGFLFVAAFLRTPVERSSK